MAHIIADRVLETSTTTGTGAFALSAAVTGFRRFSAVCATSDTCPYYIETVDVGGSPTGEWETGIGTYSAANTLTRTTVLASSNANAAVNFAAGTKRVAISLLARSFQWTEIASATPSGVNTVDFTGIPQTFTDLMIVVNGLQHSHTATNILNIGVSDGSTFSTVATLYNGFSKSGVLYGKSVIKDYRRDIGGVIGQHGVMGSSPAIVGTVIGPAYRCTGGVKGLRLKVTSANFTAGTIKLYGR